MEDVRLPIDLVPNTNPPRFRWRQTVSTPNGRQVVDYEGTLPPTVEVAVARMVVIINQLLRDNAILRGQAKASEGISQVKEERDKLQAFKDWVHAYLDAHDVPHHPPGTHGASGCRIGDRMDWLMDQLKSARDGFNRQTSLPKKGRG